MLSEGAPLVYGRGLRCKALVRGGEREAAKKKPRMFFYEKAWVVDKKWRKNKRAAKKLLTKTPHNIRYIRFYE
jgi:hypothetical protein